jgi:hypothetical protein
MIGAHLADLRDQRLERQSAAREETARAHTRRVCNRGGDVAGGALPPKPSGRRQFWHISVSLRHLQYATVLRAPRSLICAETARRDGHGDL